MKPWLILYGLLLPWLSLGLEVAGQRLSYSDFLVPILLLGAVRHVFRAGLPRGWFEGGVGLYLTAYIVSALLSDQVVPALLSSAKLLLLVAIAWSFRILGQQNELRQAALWGLGLGALGALAAGALGIGLFYLGSDWNPFQFHYGSIPVGPYPRIRGPFLNANMYCDFLVLTGAATWDLWQAYRWPVLVVATGIAFFTFSPALGGGALVVAYLTRSRGLALVSLAMLVITIVTPWEGMAWSGRTVVWSEAARLWQARPLTGWGPGQADLVVRQTMVDGRTHTLTDPHNLYLSWGAQTGLVGLVAGLFLLGSAARGHQNRSLAIGLAACWLYHGVSCSVEDFRHLWLGLGLLAASVGPACACGADG